MPNPIVYQDDFEQKRRREIIDGVITMMSPRPSVNHNRICLNIAVLFSNYLRGKPCVPFSDGVDLFLDEKNRFMPDFMAVCDPEKIQHDGVHGAPDLVVEVLSPSTAKNDRGLKKGAYGRCGVREYWIVNPEDKTVEVYLPAEGRLELHEVYAVYPDWQLKQMTEEELAALPKSFQCSLFHDLDILIEDIFYRTF
jgi:Uma2 family endonuclease